MRLLAILAAGTAIMAALLLAATAAAQESVDLGIDELNGSGVTGSATVEPYADGQTQITINLIGLEPGSSHVNHIHDGTGCGAGEYAGLVETLTNIDADDAGDGTATTIVNLAFEDVTDTNHVLVIHGGATLEDDPTPIACGHIPVASIALPQDGEEVTLDDVEAEFGDLSRSEIEARGYVVDPVCVSAELVGAPAELGAMGFHAVSEDLFDATLDPLEPEAILLGPNDEVWGVEYETSIDTEDPTVFGQEMPLLEGGHPGMEFDHYAMHVWFVENPAGQFADFNPNVSCPAPAAAPATGTGGYLSSGGSGTLTVLTLLIGIAGAALLAAGWSLRRRVSR